MAWNRSNDDSAEKRSPDRFRNKGGRRSKEATGVSLPRLPWLRGAIAALIVVVGAGIAAYFLLSRGDSPQSAPEKRNPRPIATVQPVPAKNDRPAKEAALSAPATPASDDEKWDDSFAKIPAKRYKFSKLETVTTSNIGVVNEVWVMPNGKRWGRQIDPPPIFSNPSDQTIAMALGDRSGSPIPPYPGFDDANLNQEFANSLLSPIEIKESDSPRLAALKLAVMETRREIARLIKAGDTRSVGEILRDHVAENNRKAELQGEALKGYYSALKEGGDAAAAEYLEKVNKALESYGVEPIKSQSNESKGRRRKNHE